MHAVDALKHLNFKHPATPFSAVVGSLITLGGLQAMEVLIRNIAPSAMLFMSSFAALSTLLFAAPAAPLGVAWNTLLGHSISIGIALCVHWLELLSGLPLWGAVLSPSLAIGAMAALQVVNPPAAAAAVFFAVTPLAHEQPFHGALFLLCPALVGSAWALAVQSTVARAVAFFGSRSALLSGAPHKGASGRRAVDPVVTVRCVHHASALCIAQAVEGAAYVEDPLGFIIETLTEDRNRNQQLQRLVVSFMMEEREDKIRAVQRLQQALRKRALARKASARLMQGRSVEHKAAGMARAWRAKAVVPSSQEAKELV